MSVDPGCPKRMVHGPCGGVRADLSCEVVPAPCPFAHRGTVVPWVRPVARPPASSALLDAIAAGRPVVLTDLTLPPYDAGALASVAGVLAGSCTAVLVGEHHDQPDFPPTMMAALLRQNGMAGWLTLTCRDRNRVVLEQELSSLAAAGADGVLCVTGDARARGMRPEVTQVFDLDGTRLTALAAQRGLPVAVPESPTAPPRPLRPGRLVQKERAGASVAVLNHVGSVAEVAAFLRAARAAGLTIPVIAAVAVYTDRVSAEVLQGFPGLHLDPAAVARVLAAPDPAEAGIATAAEEARQLLATGLVAGVNVSGLGSGRGIEDVARVKAEVGRRILEAA